MLWLICEYTVYTGLWILLMPFTLLFRKAHTKSTLERCLYLWSLFELTGLNVLHCLLFLHLHWCLVIEYNFITYCTVYHCISCSESLYGKNGKACLKCWQGTYFEKGTEQIHCQDNLINVQCNLYSLNFFSEVAWTLAYMLFSIESKADSSQSALN